MLELYTYFIYLYNREQVKKIYQAKRGHGWKNFKEPCLNNSAATCIILYYK